MNKKNNNINNENKTNDNKAYVVRNFRKELKRITWPTSKKNYQYFVLIFVFIIILVTLFALISYGAIEIFKLMGAAK